MQVYLSASGREGAFEPRAVKTMGRALKLSCALMRARGMQLVQDETAIRDSLARFIIEAAKTGVWEEDALARHALERFATNKNRHEIGTLDVANAASSEAAG